MEHWSDEQEGMMEEWNVGIMCGINPAYPVNPVKNYSVFLSVWACLPKPWSPLAPPKAGEPRRRQVCG